MKARCGIAAVAVAKRRGQKVKTVKTVIRVENECFKTMIRVENAFCKTMIRDSRHCVCADYVL